MSSKRSSENRQVWEALIDGTVSPPQHAGGGPGHAIAALCDRFTLRQTRRTVPFMFSIALAQASERRSIAGNPRRLTVGIGSNT